MVQVMIANPQDLTGQTAFDLEGAEVGTIAGVYLDNATRRPEWAAVRIDGSTLTLVPLDGARTARGGLELGFDRQLIARSPFREHDLIREVSQDTEDKLYRHYGLRGDGDGGGQSNGNGFDLPEPVQEVKEEVQDTAATAADKATEVAGTAKEQAASVVETAKEEAAEVASEVSTQAREMVETTRSQLSGQASTQVQALADGMHRLAGQALALARGNPEMAGPVADWVGRAGREVQTVAGNIDAKGGVGLLDDATRIVRERPRAVVFGTAIALVAGGKLFRSPAGDKVKEKLAPLKEQAVQAGRNVAEELKPVAQQRVEQIKTVATNAADQIKADAQGAAEDVKGEAKRSSRAVKGTARSSAETVRATAKSSARTVRSTARQRAAASTT